MRILRQDEGRGRTECCLREGEPFDLPAFRTDRRTKIRVIRRQIRQGEYDIDSRLAAIIDRIVENIVG